MGGSNEGVRRKLEVSEEGVTRKFRSKEGVKRVLKESEEGVKRERQGIGQGGRRK